MLLRKHSRGSALSAFRAEVRPACNPMASGGGWVTRSAEIARAHSNPHEWVDWHGRSTNMSSISLVSPKVRGTYGYHFPPRARARLHR